MPTQVKVMLVDRSSGQPTPKAQGIADSGFAVVATFGRDDDWTDEITQARPDVVIIDSPRVDERLLDQVKAVTAHSPVPIALFSDDDETEKIFAAVDAGVNAFSAGGLVNGNLRHAVDVALAQFTAHTALLDELDRVNAALAERKVVERAKGIIMKTRSLDEAEAYRLMRQVAMSRNVRMAQLAEVIIEAEDLLKSRPPGPLAHGGSARDRVSQ